MQEVAEDVNIKVTFTGIRSLKLQGCFDFEFLKGANVIRINLIRYPRGYIN
jgi:hypothetical protein